MMLEEDFIQKSLYRQVLAAIMLAKHLAQKRYWQQDATLEFALASR